jgi:hypothetical protein
MSSVAIYVATLVVTMICSLAVVLLLRPALHRLLVDLCGTENRAAFWTAFSTVALLLAPLLGAMHRRPEAGGDPAFALAAQLEWALGGLLAAVLLVGAVLARSIVAFEHQRDAARRADARAELRGEGRAEPGVA